VRQIEGALGELRSFFDTVPLNSSEKRQIAEIDKALANLRAKLAANAVAEDVLGRLTVFVDALQKRDYNAATREQLALVNAEWAEHKDWLKGIKFLVQLITKKM